MRRFAFLRAINVGRRRLTMERLRALAEELGFDGVETFIASGNFVFEAKEKNPAKLERRIEKHLRDALGYDVDTFVRTRAELAAIAAARPFGAQSAGPVYVGFLATEPVRDAVASLAAFRSEIDDFRVVGREVYWLSRDGMGQSAFSGAKLERLLGMPTTLRNLNTVDRLLAKYA